MAIIDKRELGRFGHNRQKGFGHNRQKKFGHNRQDHWQDPVMSLLTG